MSHRASAGRSGWARSGSVRSGLASGADSGQGPVGKCPGYSGDSGAIRY